MTNIVIFPGEENTLLIIGFVHSHVHCGTVDHILKREQDALESQSERLLDTEMSNVLDLFTKSSLLDMRAQNKINCLLGPTKSPTNIMMVLKNNVLENNCKEIVEELL